MNKEIDLSSGNSGGSNNNQNKAYFYLPFSVKTLYIGSGSAWGENATLPYRAAIPCDDNDVFNGIKSQKIYTENFEYVKTKFDSSVDDGNGGKKKYYSYKFKPNFDCKCKVDIDFGFIMKAVDINDWIAIGIDEEKANGNGNIANWTAGINIQRDKLNQTQQATFNINGCAIVDLSKDKWYVVYIQSLARGYLNNCKIKVESI